MSARCLLSGAILVLLSVVAIILLADDSTFSTKVRDAGRRLTDHGHGGTHDTTHAPGHGTHDTTQGHGATHDPGHGTTHDPGHGTTHGSGHGTTHGHGGSTTPAAMSTTPGALHDPAHMYDGKVDMINKLYTYDPNTRIDPFDTAAQDVSQWLTAHDEPFECGHPHWVGDFCSCIENGNIAAWYQMSPAVYVVKKCSEGDGFELRSGHLQFRYLEVLQSQTACDVLKLISYCFRNVCEPALNHWNTSCKAAHFTVPGCDVNCNAATPRFSFRVSTHAILLVVSLTLAMLQTRSMAA